MTRPQRLAWNGSGFFNQGVLTSERDNGVDQSSLAPGGDETVKPELINPNPLEVDQSSLAPGGDETLDGALCRSVLLLQKKRGYRFSVDSILLADFVADAPAGPAVDLGCGCGVIMLVLAELWQRQGERPSLVGVEQSRLSASLARRNVLLNRRASQIKVRRGDLRERGAEPAPGQWAQVTFNPPYRPLQSGRASPLSERAAARHEVYGSLEELVQAGARLLGGGGRFSLVYPAGSLARLMAALQQVGLRPLRLCAIHSQAQEEASRVLLEASRGRHELRLQPPLILYDENQQYTPAAREILEGRRIPPLQGKEEG